MYGTDMSAWLANLIDEKLQQEHREWLKKTNK